MDWDESSLKTASDGCLEDALAMSLSPIAWLDVEADDRRFSAALFAIGSNRCHAHDVAVDLHGHGFVAAAGTVASQQRDEREPLTLLSRSAGLVELLDHPVADNVHRDDGEFQGYPSFL